MIGVTVRRLPMWQRVALFLVFVVLADFSADDGCGCNDITGRSSTAISTHHQGVDHGV